MKPKRRKELLKRLVLAAELACESHTADGRQERLESVFNLVIELMSRRKVNNEWRKALTDLMAESSVGAGNLVENADGELHVEGFFDYKTLHERMILLAVQPELIGGANE